MEQKSDFAPRGDAKTQVDLQTGWCLSSAVQRSSEVIP